MGIGYDLTKQNLDITPFYAKVLSSGLYVEIDGVHYTSVTSTGILDNTDYMLYDASYSLNGVGQSVSVTPHASVDAAFVTNSLNENEAGHRLLAFKINNTIAGTQQGLYEWYQDDNNYERLWYDSFTQTFHYQVKIGGSLIYDLSAINSPDENSWHIIQIVYSTNATPHPTVTILLDGIVIVTATEDLTDTPVTLTAISVRFGQIIDGVSTFVLDGAIDLFLIRKGLMFSLLHAENPTSAVWSIEGFNNPLIIRKDIGVEGLPMPSVFSPRQVPQNIPCFAHAYDKLFITGLITNKKVYNLKPSEGVIFSVANQATAAAHPGGIWDYAISWYDSVSGQESKLSEWEESASITLNNTARVRVYVGLDSRADKIKLYRRLTSSPSTVYFVGIFDMTQDTSGIIYCNDGYATADLTVVENLEDEELYAIEDIGLIPPELTGCHLYTKNSGTGSWPNETFSFVLVQRDPHTGLKSPPILLANLIAGTPPATFTARTTNEIGNITIGAAAAELQLEIPANLGIRYKIDIYIKRISQGDLYWFRYDQGGFGNVYNSGLTASAQTIPLLYSSAYLSAERVDNLTLQLPPVSNIIAFHNGRMFFGCQDGFLNRVYYTDVDNFELVSSQAYFNVGEDNGEAVTGMLSYRGNLLIWKERSIFILVGDTPEEFQLVPLSRAVGCVAHQTIKLINDIVFWAFVDGVHRYDGGTVKLVSDDISDIFNNMDARQRPLMSAAVDIENNLYLLALRRTPVPEAVFDSSEEVLYNYNNDTILCYNYREGIQDDIHHWTTWDIDCASLGQGYDDYDKLSKPYFTKLGLDGGFGFFDPKSNKDFGNLNSTSFSWTWISQHIAMNYGSKHAFGLLRAHLDPDNLSVSHTIQIGYKIKNTETVSSFSINSTFDRLRKKISTRSQFIKAVLRCTNNTENLKIVGFSLDLTEVRG